MRVLVGRGFREGEALLRPSVSQPLVGSIQIEPQAMERIAEFIGTNAIALLALWLAALLGAIAGGWHLLDRHRHVLWRRAEALWVPLADWPALVWLRQRFPRLWRFIGRRLSPQGYLGLHVTLGIIVLLATLYLFVGLAEEVGPDKEIARFDEALATQLHLRATPSALALFAAITHLGDPLVLAAVGVAVAAVLVSRRAWLLLTSWVVALLGAGVLNLALKELFQRARPALPNPFLVAAGWSFPSGHAMGALVVYGMLGYLLVLGFGRRRRLVVVGVAALVTLVGASRMFLGVHYASDVVAGFAAGIAWLAIVIAGAEVPRRRTRELQAGAPGESPEEGMALEGSPPGE